MKPSLISSLACPSCKGTLEAKTLREDERGDIMEGSLSCRGCCEVFPIRGGVPRLLPKSMSPERSLTAERFGGEWKRYSRFLPQYREAFRDWIAPLSWRNFEGKLVLDAGCGMGRFTWVASELGAREVIGFDLSPSVDVAYALTRENPRVHIVQGDIFNPPFRDELFDFIFSIGVLHHLPDPKEGFLCLLPLLKSEAQIFVWVYGEEGNGWIINYMDPLRKRFFSRLPAPLLSSLTHPMAFILWASLKGLYLPSRKLNPSLGPRLLPYYDYMTWLSGFGYYYVHHVIYDQLTPPITHYISREALAGWFREGELLDVKIWPRNNNSWRGFGVKGKAFGN